MLWCNISSYCYAEKSGPDLENFKLQCALSFWNIQTKVTNLKHNYCSLSYCRMVTVVDFLGSLTRNHWHFLELWWRNRNFLSWKIIFQLNDYQMEIMLLSWPNHHYNSQRTYSFLWTWRIPFKLVSVLMADVWKLKHSIIKSGQLRC